MTDIVVRQPRLWRLFRGRMRGIFERLAPVWDERLSPQGLSAYESALARLPTPPRRVLDLGTGTGRGALAIARRFVDAQVIGVDLSPRMLDEARRKVPPELVGRLHFELADAARLPYADSSFDVVAHANMIPFFDETARVLEAGGHAVFAFSAGAETPIYVPFERLRRELEARGFTEFAEIDTGPGTALLARKRTSR
jgi:ubiquinone/menaquinone biosynthesis C-methylase UbiE